MGRDRTLDLPGAYRGAVGPESAARCADVRRMLADAVVSRAPDVLTRALHELSSVLDIKCPMTQEETVFCVRAVCDVLWRGGIGVDAETRCADAITRLIKPKKGGPLKALPALELSWRPLYQRIRSAYFPKKRQPSLVNRQTHGASLVVLARMAAPYWGTEATREIWDELRPELCPHSDVVFMSGFLATFLPTSIPEATRWVAEAFSMWRWFENSPDWDVLWMDLLARVAQRQPAGSVDWSPYVDFVFSTILRLFELPVGSGPFSRVVCNDLDADVGLFITSGKKKELCPIAWGAKFVIYMLTPDHNGRPMQHLRDLLRTIEPYYHPSNGGNWSTKLAQFLESLCSYFSKRVAMERRDDTTTPSDQKLTAECVHAFIEMVFPVLLKAQFSKSHSVMNSATQSAMCLTAIEPCATIPTLLDTIFPALETLVETHQTTSALNTLGAIARVMLSRDKFPQGPQYLSRLLYATLPGIDANDLNKTATTLKFYQEVFSCVPIIDSTAVLAQYPGDGTPEHAAWLATGMLSDWANIFFDRIFTIYNYQVVTERMNIESVIGGMIKAVADVLFQQMDDATFAMSLDKLAKFVQSNVLMNAIKAVGHLIASASRARPAESLRVFMPLCSRMLIDDETGKLRQLSDSEILWNLRIANQCVRMTGAPLVEHKNAVFSIIHACYASPEHKVTSSVAKLVKNVLKSLTHCYPLESRSHPPSAWSAADFARTHFLRWGEQPRELEVRWHVPDDSEVAFAAELFDDVAGSAIAQLEDLMSASASDHGNAYHHATRMCITPEPVLTPSASTPAAERLLPEALCAPCVYRTRPMPIGQSPLPSPHPSPPGSPRSAQRAMSVAYAATMPHAVSPPMQVVQCALSPRFPAAQQAPTVVVGSPVTPQHVGGSRAMSLGSTPGAVSPALAYLWATRRSRDTAWRLVVRLRSAIAGGSFLIPDTPGEEPSLTESQFPGWKRPEIAIGPSLGGRTVLTRTRVGQFLHRFCHFTQENFDEEPSLLTLVTQTIGKFINDARGVNRGKLISVLTAMELLKKTVAGKIVTGQGPTRSMQIYKASLLHHMRVNQMNSRDNFTQTYDDLIDDLRSLSLNSYSEVRKEAQPAMAMALRRFPYVLEKFIPGVTYVIGSPMSAPEEVTGAAYLLHQGNILRKLHMLSCCLPFFVNMCRSHTHTKPTVQVRLTNLFSSVASIFDPPPLETPAPLDAPPQFVVDAGVELPTPQALLRARLDAAQRTEENVRRYDAAIDDLLEIAGSPNLPWRYLMMVVSCIVLLSRTGRPLPLRAVDLLIRGVFSDVGAIRAVCWKGIGLVLLRTKAVQRRRREGSAQVAGAMPAGGDLYAAPPPASEAEWSRTHYFDKTHVGWNALPGSMDVYDYAGGSACDAARELCAEHRMILAALERPGAARTLFDLLVNAKRSSRTGQPVQGASFSDTAAQAFKGIAQSLGMRGVCCLAQAFREHAALADEAASQCVAAEFVAGVVRGSKHWAHAQQAELAEAVGPALRDALSSCTPDSLNDWAFALRFALYDRDPRRLHWVTDPIVEAAAGDLACLQGAATTTTAFSQMKRLKLLQQVTSEYSWRAPSLHRTIFDLLQKAMDHPYKQVRDRVALLLKISLRNMWENDGNTAFDAPVNVNERAQAFLDWVVASPHFDRAAAITTTAAQTEEEQSSVSFVRTVVAFTASAVRGEILKPDSLVDFCVQVLPKLFMLQEHPIRDISREVQCCITLMAHLPIPPAKLASMFEMAHTVMRSASWHSRLSALMFIEVVFWRHFFMLDASRMDQLLSTMEELLSDPQLEVREQACQTLSGLLKLLDSSKSLDLSRRFLARASAALPIRRVPANKAPQQLTPQQQQQLSDAVVGRHGGVLGIAAIVLSQPYDLPEWMPSLLLDCAAHISDPMPIKATVKRTFMEFWRTHSDMWEQVFKRQFTPDQLSDLTQLLVSPSYFA
eukprot:m51a1_g6199 hypothetical protein (1944) ;mRNA; r:106776-114561